MNKKADVAIERDFTPFPVLRHASDALQQLHAEGGRGSTWVGLGALVLLAFAVEGFCQTEGPAMFGADWTEGKKIEKKPVLEKLKLIGKRAGATVDYGRLPWSDVHRLIKARDMLAHPRPAQRCGSANVVLSEEQDPIDQVAHLVEEPWESLLDVKVAAAVASSVDQAIQEIWGRLGREQWRLRVMGMTTYFASTQRE